MNEPDKESQDQERLVVDDDWKEQVEREKESLKQQMEDQHAESGDSEMPPASLPLLINTLAMQALASLGQIPDPIEGKAVVRKSVAKHFIDTLAVLEEKTKGNLDAEETEMLGGTLHQLRMVFVSTSETAPTAEDDQGPAKSSSIELP